MGTENIDIVLNIPRSFRVTVFPPGETPLSSKWGFSVKVEDDGEDVTAQVRGLTIHGDPRRQYAEVELEREGFDGPFCTPAIPF